MTDEIPPEMAPTALSKWQITRGPEIRVAERNFSAAEIIAKLGAHLTGERMARIDGVIDQRTFHVATVVEHLYDIGNISAVMRSAESFGFLPFHIVERPGAKYKMSDRISRGSEKWLDIHRHTSTPVCLRELKNAGYRIYASDLSAKATIHEIDFSQPSAVIFGNERDGISEEVRNQVDACFILPMHGFAQSFNISVAAALTFQTIHRQREARGMVGDLIPSEKLSLRAQYYLRTLSSAEDILRK